MKPQEMIDVLQAFQNGKQIEIQWKCDLSRWFTLEPPAWDFTVFNYRVKSETTKTLYKFLCKIAGDKKYPYYETPKFYSSLKEAQEHYINTAITVICQLNHTKITIEE